MSNVATVFPESIDDVLQAVQETPRGRWFLEAYTARVKGEDTSSVLQAIAKLENHLSTIGSNGAEAGLLQQARKAIAAAKAEIAKFEPQTANLSVEGQLFAKLAELSRHAFSNSAPSELGISNGVDRVLKLVAELEQNLGSGSNDNLAAAPAKPAIQYFKQDEEVFEPAPAPALAAVPKPSPEPSNKGAKLVIHRSAKPLTETPVAEPEAIASTPVVETKAPETPRIVIIRRKAEEVSDVPLLDEQNLTSMSAA